MNKISRLCLRAVLSLFIAGLLMIMVSSLLHWVNPDYSLDFSDMLALRSPSAWLLLALATAIVFAALARLRPFRRRRRADHPESRGSE